MEHQTLPNDLGPIYKETLMGRWPVEPWNTTSNLAFLVVIVYWLIKIKWDYKKQGVIFTTMLVTAIGFVGGTVYHSTRSHLFWLLLDWIPIVVNANILAIYFWRALGVRWAIVGLSNLIPLLFNFAVFAFPNLRTTLSASMGYFVLVVSVLLPLYFYARSLQWRSIHLPLWALGTVLAALLLRTLDQHPMMDVFPMGTHFLWHLLGALTCHLMALYVFKTQKQDS